MNIERKDATIANLGSDDEFPGEFEVVLTTPKHDRDGDELGLDEWKMPLPERISFDMDHGMSVATTVASGVPTMMPDGIHVRGSYSSLARGQDVRTLVREGHITHVSVAFLATRNVKDGKTRMQRELLNGAFVAIPSNTDARVLSSKSGARHNETDARHIQSIYDHAVALGAGPTDDTGAEDGVPYGASFTGEVGTKGKYSAEQLRTMLAEGHAMRGPNGKPDYPIGDEQDLHDAIHAVGRGEGDHDAIRRYIMRRARQLGEEHMIPEDWHHDSGKSYTRFETKALTEAQRLARGVDAALDEACNLLAGCDTGSLPAEVKQALDLLTAAGETSDQLLDAMNVENPDEATDDAPGEAKSLEAEVGLKAKLAAITASAFA